MPGQVWHPSHVWPVGIAGARCGIALSKHCLEPLLAQATEPEEAPVPAPTKASEPVPPKPGFLSTATLTSKGYLRLVLMLGGHLPLPIACGGHLALAIS